MVEQLSANFSVTRRHGIDMAHRVPLHASKCRNLHGHRYTIEATYTASSLHAAGEQSGMVMDFGFIKEDYLRLFDYTFDHGTTLYYLDPLVNLFTYGYNELHKQLLFESEQEFFHIPDSMSNVGKLVIIKHAPTAEILAAIWRKNLQRIVDKRFAVAVDVNTLEVRVSKLVVWETPNCSAISED